MTSNYEFDAIRWCKVRARAARAARCFAEENNYTRIAAELACLRTENEQLRRDVAALVERGE